MEKLARQREENVRRLDEIIARWHQHQQEQDEARQREAETQRRRHFEQQVKNLTTLLVKRKRTHQRQAKKQTQADQRRRVLVEAWDNYEKRWQVLRSIPFLTFRSIPWPVISSVNTPESLLPQLITDFILSPEHSQAKSRKRRIHSALIRWHTDHFDAKFLHKVVDGDRKAVVEGVGRVVRCLNGMLEREGVA
jgi:hypothetical protein